MSISWMLFRSDGPPKLQTLAKPFALAIVPCRWDEAGGEHHEHQLGASDGPPKLQTLAKPFAPVIAPMGRGGRRAS